MLFVTLLLVLRLILGSVFSMVADKGVKTDWGKVVKCLGCGWFIGVKILKAYRGVCPKCGVAL